MNRALIAFGSNLGDREALICRALKSLSQSVGIAEVSGFYETEPMYVEDQPAFLNGAIVATTSLDPIALLALLKSIENEVGRQVRYPNGPREIDLDIIDIEGVSRSEAPVVPHPRAHERRFVLEPLNEIAPDWLLEGYGRVCDLLAKEDVQSQSVRRVADAPVLL